MHNYANFGKSLHATDTIFLSSLCAVTREVFVKFHPDPISSLEEKFEQTGKHTDGGTDSKTKRINI